MPLLVWRPPTNAEHDLAQRWLTEWNAATGDSASLPPELEAADSCGCGACPSFAVSPIALTAPEREATPLVVEGGAVNADGDQAGLIGFWSDDVLELELFPYEDRPMTNLAELTVTLHRSQT